MLGLCVGEEEGSFEGTIDSTGESASSTPAASKEPPVRRLLSTLDCEEAISCMARFSRKVASLFAFCKLDCPLTPASVAFSTHSDTFEPGLHQN